MAPKTAVGTYGIYDRDGSKGYDGLYTNNQATLYPKATDAEVVGKGEAFQKPTVSYTVASVPQTGDTTPLGMLLALAGLAAAALFILNAGRKQHP